MISEHSSTDNGCHEQSTGSGGLKLQNLLRLFGLPLILVAVFMAFSLVTDTFFTAENLSGLLRSASISALLILGMTWIFTTGEMDVSFVAIAALANMVCAGLVIAGYGWPLASLCAIFASLAVGLLNGILIARLGLPSLVITIATGGMASALAAAIGRGSSIGINEPSFLDVLFEVQIGIVLLIGLPVLLLILIAWYMQERLTIGHYVFAMATNPRAVLEAGVPVVRIKLMLCVFLALCNGLAGILLAVELSSGQPSIAQSLFLDGLTAVLLGGTMLKLG